MSQEALDYVESSAPVLALPFAEKFVLRQIALLHRLEVNCAFVGLPELTRMALIGGKDAQRQCRRILERLERKGFLLRHASVRENGSQTTNEYTLPGLKMGMAVTEEARQRLFKTPRTRVAAQQSLFFTEDSIAATSANGSSSSAVADTNRSTSLAVADSAVGSGRLAVENTADCPPPPGHLNVLPPPDTLVSSLDVSFDVSKEVKLPLPLLFAADGGKTSNGNGKSAHQEQKPEATASAKANATTPANEAAVAPVESLGEARLSPGPGFRVGGNVIPFGRRARRDADPRAGLDGEEAALYDVTMEVLGECGIAAKNATRCQRNAVSEALRDEAARCGESLHAVGQRAVSRWDDYVKVADRGLLWRVVGVKKFFGEGYWLEHAGHPWDYDQSAVAEQQRRYDSGIGMRR